MVIVHAVCYNVDGESFIAVVKMLERDHQNKQLRPDVFPYARQPRYVTSIDLVLIIIISTIV